jgi:hypothetical protein
MNDKTARQGRFANSAAEDVSSGRGRFDRGYTPLQQVTIALRDLVLDARDELSEEAYGWFVAVGTEVFGLEAARLFVGETLRATRDDEGRQAA